MKDTRLNLKLKYKDTLKRLNAYKKKHRLLSQEQAINHLLKEENKVLQELENEVQHWHDLFREHSSFFEGKLTKDSKFMLGYYSGRKDGALKSHKLIQEP